MPENNSASRVRGITLAELLDAREQRAYQQQKLITQYQSPLISLTISMPGAVKLNEDALFLFTEATNHIVEYCKIHQLDCLTHHERILPTGAEGFFVVREPEHALKQACIAIEHTHELGRLWDIDVISVKSFTALSRTALGYPARKCLLCENDAKICTRGQTHGLEELLEKIKQIVETYRSACDI